MPKPIETLLAEFETMLRDITRDYAMKRYGKNQSRVYQRIAMVGPIEATREMIRGRSHGGNWLVENGSHHLCIEWQVLNPYFARLFSDEDRARAWGNLNVWAHELTGKPDQRGAA